MDRELEMDTVHPLGLADLPPDFAKPSTRYRTHAWLAMLGLVAFVGGYTALTGWFVWTTYRLFEASSQGDGASFMFGLASLFFSIFLLKALFFIKRGGSSGYIEVKASEQPRLFNFINQLATELRAPKPHRIYLSPQVNAAVFYDFSLINLVFPSRKNLVIGLGLVNVLNISEFKSVLAHELGHFAQRSMAIGRWVYISQQIAAHIVGKRDALDRFIDGVSNWDLRIAWVGWIFKVIVWAIRSLIEAIFMLVMLAEKSLSREMEFQADLVSVSATGSDALVNSLHKLGAADQAWSRALSFANAEVSSGQPGGDVFVLQQYFIQKTAELLNDPLYGRSPNLEEMVPSYRLFGSSTSDPPNMWATHPSNRDREENAKRVYILADTQPASSWELFDDIDGAKRSVIVQALGKFDSVNENNLLALKKIDAQFDLISLRPEYRSTYLRRSIVRDFETVAELYEDAPTDLPSAARALYPEVLTSDMEQWRSLDSERDAILTHLIDKQKLSSKTIAVRGQNLSGEKITKAAEQIENEFKQLTSKIHAHDRLCRSTHLAMASAIGDGWDSYLRGLLAIHHYSAHTEALLRNARSQYHRVLNQELSRGASRRPNIDAILKVARVVYTYLADAHEDAPLVQLDPLFARQIGFIDWAERLQELRLSAPTSDNLSDWAQKADGWINDAIESLGTLRFASLEHLLATEKIVSEKFFENNALGLAPSPTKVPETYATLTFEKERKRFLEESAGHKMWSLDGLGGTIGGAIVAAGVICSVFVFASELGHTTVTIYNALGVRAHISIGQKSTIVDPFRHNTIDIVDASKLHIKATTDGGNLIEEFVETTAGRGAHHVYNVASAGALVAWTAVYGNAVKVPPRPLGAPRFINLRSDVEFEKPPTSIKTKGGGGSRSVLTGLGAEPPEDILGALSDTDEMVRIVRLHARWDAPSTPHYAAWKDLASRIK